MHFSRLAPLAILACSHLVVSQSVNLLSAAAVQTGVTAASTGSATPGNNVVAASNTTTSDSGTTSPDSSDSNGVPGAVSATTNTTSTEENGSASTGSIDPDLSTDSNDPAAGNSTSTGATDTPPVGGNGGTVSDLTSTNSTSTDFEASESSAPSSAPTLDASSMPHDHNGTDHDHHDHHDHHEHGEKSGHPHHHPHINGTVADFDKHKNRTGERIHFTSPIEEKVDIGHVDKRLEIDGKPIQLGPGLEIPPTETNIPTTFWRLGHEPVVKREADPKIPAGVEDHHGSNVSPAEKMGHHPHHVEREVSPGPEPIWLGGGVGPVVTPKTPVETHKPIFLGHGPVIHEEREAKSIENRHAGNHNDTELVENERFNATGKGHPHHEHAGEHHKNGTEHYGIKPEHGHKPNGTAAAQLPDTTELPVTLPTMTPDTYQGPPKETLPIDTLETRGEFANEMHSDRYNETELPHHHKFNETGHGHPKHDGKQDQGIKVPDVLTG